MNVRDAREIRKRRGETLRGLGEAQSGAHARALAAAHLDAFHSDRDKHLARLPVGELLTACRGVGAMHRDRVLALAGEILHGPGANPLDRSRRIGTLSVRERRAVCGALEHRWPYESTTPDETRAVGA